MQTEPQNEIFPVVDEQANTIGSATRAECHNGSMLLHPVVHLHVLNSQGQLYLQLRPTWKDIQPGKWDSGVGGHIDYGEQTVDALYREAREELGIEGFEAREVCSYIFESERERELVNVFTCVIDSKITPSDETAGGRFWSPEQLSSSLGEGVFTPNFESELQTVLIPNGIIKI